MVLVLVLIEFQYGSAQAITKKLSFRKAPTTVGKDIKGTFRIIVFADLLLSSNDTHNQ